MPEPRPLVAVSQIGLRFRLDRLEDAEFEAIMANDECAKMIGIPQFYNSAGDIWPAPDTHWHVEVDDAVDGEIIRFKAQ